MLLFPSPTYQIDSTNIILIAILDPGNHDTDCLGARLDKIYDHTIDQIQIQIMRERATSRCMEAPKLLEMAFNDMVVLSLVSTASVGSIDKTSAGGQSFAINEDEGSAN